MVTAPSGLLPTTGKSSGARPLHQAGSPCQSQLSPLADVIDCSSAPSGAISTVSSELAMRIKNLPLSPEVLDSPALMVEHVFGRSVRPVGEDIKPVRAVRERRADHRDRGAIERHGPIRLWGIGDKPRHVDVVEIAAGNCPHPVGIADDARG